VKLQQNDLQSTAPFPYTVLDGDMLAGKKLIDHRNDWFGGALANPRGISALPFLPSSSNHGTLCVPTDQVQSVARLRDRTRSPFHLICSLMSLLGSLDIVFGEIDR
jgi:hypothetical protein